MSDDTQSSPAKLTIPDRAWKIFGATGAGVIAAQLLGVVLNVAGLYGQDHYPGQHTSKWGILPFATFVLITGWPTTKLLWGRVGPRGTGIDTWFAQCVRVFAVFTWLSIGVNLLAGNLGQVTSAYAAFVFVTAFFGQLRDEWNAITCTKSVSSS